ncbi:MAG: protein phosphatase 2C domain-containing protein [bacterium]|nr:protein phosphatase 2C domain-containing protein [bacterium]
MIYYEIRTHQGSRENNEDYASVQIKGKEAFFALADGLGGHGRGEVASQIAVETALQSLMKGDSIAESFMKAEYAVEQEQEKRRAFDEMKTTLTLLKITGETAEWGHVGDSRMYHFSRWRMIERTRDHSVPQMLVEAGKLKEKEIRHHEDRNRLLQVIGAMGERKVLECDSKSGKKVKKGQAFLLCSDGWWELIEEKQMLSCLRKAKTVQAWMDSMEAVIQESGREKDMDNYTAIGIFL